MFGLLVEKLGDLKIAHERIEFNDGVVWRRVDDDNSFEDGREALYEEGVFPFMV